MITERIDSITRIRPEQLKEIAPFPKSVKIELTAACNYQCSFCPLQDREEADHRSMDLDFFKRITTEMKEAGVEEIGVFYIGESMLRPKLLVSAISFLKQELRMPYVFLTSNGSAASTDLLDSIMGAGLDSLKWSLNAYNADQFSSLMGVSPSLFPKVAENIQKAYDIRQTHKYTTKLYASSIQYDDEQQGKMESYLSQNVLPYVDQHYWLPLYNSTGFAAKREKELGHKPTAGNQGRLGALREPLPCWAVFTEGHVRVDGALTACCFDATGKWDIANLHDMSFKEAWNAESFQKLRRAHIKKKIEGTPCVDCVLTK